MKPHNLFGQGYGGVSGGFALFFGENPHVQHSIGGFVEFIVARQNGGNIQTCFGYHLANLLLPR